MQTTPAIALHGAAVYPYSPALHERFRLDGKFSDDDGDASYELCLKHGDELWIPRRLAPDTELDLREDGVAVDFTVNFTPSNEDQARVVGEVRNLLKLEVSHIAQAPTGYGKTYVGSAAIGYHGRRALILTTKQDLMKQWREALENVLGLSGDEIGMWCGDTVPSKNAKVVIGLVQSVLKGPVRYPEWMFRGYGLVVCDEVHRMGADEFSQAMWWLPAKLRLGLSATPYRKDGKEVVFHSHIGDVLVVGTQETLIPNVIMKHMPWKCPRRLKRDPKTKKDFMERVPHKAGRTAHVLKSIIRTVECNVEIAKFSRLAYERGRTNLILSDTMEHLKELRRYIVKSGVKEADCGWYVGLSADVYTGNPRAREEQRTKATKARVIFATYQMCSEGTNIPWLDTCVLAAPRSDVNQIVGRIRREYPDKKQPLVFHPVYKDSPVFASYAAKALQWYRSLGAKVTVYR